MTAKTITEVLVDHQRHNLRSCLCGWDALGKSHPAHQEDMLSDAGFGDVREAAAAGVYALENAWGSNGRATIKSKEAINAARQMLDGEWDSLIKCEMELHPRRIRARASTMRGEG